MRILLFSTIAILIFGINGIVSDGHAQKHFTGNDDSPILGFQYITTNEEFAERNGILTINIDNNHLDLDSVLLKIGLLDHDGNWVILDKEDIGQTLEFSNIETGSPIELKIENFKVDTSKFSILRITLLSPSNNQHIFDEKMIVVDKTQALLDYEEELKIQMESTRIFSEVATWIGVIAGIIGTVIVAIKLNRFRNKYVDF